MNVNTYCLDFFLGVTSPSGFCSYFNEITDYKQNWRNYIIKGGPGTGKSSLMKKIANKLYDHPSNVELIHCSSDPYSLDGVISYDDNFAIFDGTAPHVVEPLYPGVFETNVNLSEFWDESKLSTHSDTIIKLFKKNKEFHERNLRFLKAASQIINDNFQLVLKNTNTSKIYKLAKRIVLKEFSKKKKRTGIEKKRFLSAITPNGYITFTDTAKKLVELIHCSSDPYSLDGVISYDDNFAIFDGTAPHVVEPLYPGVFETNINLSEFWDESKLSEHSDTIIKLFKKNKEFHERNLRFLKAASQIINDNFQLALKNTNTSKIYKLSKRIVLKEFSKRKKRIGIEKKRFLSAITPNGYITFTDTAKKLAKKIYIIKDEIGVSSSLLLSFIRKYLLEYGYSFYTCYSPFDPYNKIEHIFIPELNLGFMTHHKFNELNIEHFRIINFSRFVNIEALKRDKQKINLNRKLISELVNESIASLKTAKSIHDDMEEFYINAMNFDLVHKKADQIIENINNNK